MEQHSKIYIRRRPENTVIFQTVNEYWDQFLAELEISGNYLPSHVIKEMEAFLRCGILAYGFVRTGCTECKKEHLVAFSCKKRGFCASCLGRRMAELTIHLQENVFLDVPVRQYVLSVPIPLRYWMASNKILLRKVHTIVAAEVNKYLISKVRKHHNEKVHTGSVTFVQRFGSALNLNIHFHMLVTEGYFIEKTTGRMKFYALPAPTDEEIGSLVEKISAKTIKLLRKLEYLEDSGDFSECQPPDKLFEEQPVYAATMQASTQYKISVGIRNGQPLRRIGSGFGFEGEETQTTSTRCAYVNGFSLHANVAIKAQDKDRLDKLVRYMARPSVDTKRLFKTKTGDLLYQLKKPFADGTTHFVYSPFEFIEKLIALIPPPRVHMVRYSGVYAPHAKHRKQATVLRKEELEQKAQEQKAPEKRRYIPWAMLLKRTFKFDLDVCTLCGQKTKVIAALHSPGAIVQILEHLKIDPRPPPRGRFDTAGPKTLFSYEQVFE